MHFGAWTIIAVGLALRLYHYFDNRGLWFEEALLGINFLERSFIGLTQPLDYDQQAPRGFLFAEKLAVILFGEQEMVLRLFPLLCGLSSLILFYQLIKNILSGSGIIAALMGMAFAYPVLYHSVEAKQYSTELLITVLLYLSYYRYSKRTDFKGLFEWGLLGAVMVWFSFPAVFVEAGIAVGLLGVSLFNRNRQRILQLFLTFSLWGLSFLLNYLFFIRQGTSIDWLVNYWYKEGAFMPLTTFMEIGQWFVRITSKLLDYPLGVNWMHLRVTGFLRYSIPALVFLPLGIYQCFRKQKELFILLLLPLLFAIIASAMRLYPFMGRLLLFAVPIFLVFIGFGAERVTTLISRYLGKTAIGVLFILFLSPLLFNNIAEITNPSLFHNRQDAREAFLFIRDRIQKNEKVYIHNANYNSLFRYYSHLYRLPYQSYILPSVDIASTHVVDSLLSLSGKSNGAWFVFNPGIRYRKVLPSDLNTYKSESATTQAGIWLHYITLQAQVDQKFTGEKATAIHVQRD